MYWFTQKLDVRGDLRDVETNNEVETRGPFLCRDFLVSITDNFEKGGGMLTALGRRKSFHNALDVR